VRTRGAGLRSLEGMGPKKRPQSFVHHSKIRDDIVDTKLQD
jgi:hypothetical protein